VVVAVVAVRMVQVVVDQVVHVIPVRHGLMATIGAVLVALVMAATRMLRRARSRIRSGDRKGVLFDVVTLQVVQVAIVQVIDVAVVQNPGVAAARTVLVRVALVLGRHV
jgi:hypothetical protein